MSEIPAKQLKFIKGHTPEIVYSILKTHTSPISINSLTDLAIENGAESEKRVKQIIKFFIKKSIITRVGDHVLLSRTDAVVTPGGKLTDNQIIAEIRNILKEPSSMLNTYNYKDRYDHLKSKIEAVIARCKKQTVQQNNRLHRLIDKNHD